MFGSTTHHAYKASSPTASSGLYLTQSPNSLDVGRMEPTDLFYSKPNQPVVYKVQVTTGKGLLTGTFDAISITLVGTNGESAKHLLNRVGTSCAQGWVEEHSVTCDYDLGPILLIRLHKDPYSFFPESSWFCNTVQVKSPEGEVYHFPCYSWIEGYCTVSFREGAAKTASDDTHYLQRRHRREELMQRHSKYGWKEYLPGVPWCADIDTVNSMEYNIQYSFPKSTAFFGRGTAALFEAKLKGFLDKPYSWGKLEDIRKIFWFYHSPVSEYVFEHWKDDEFFGYQFLNGINPIMIQKCTKIPENFPVTEDMVAGPLGEDTTLQEELKKGTIFLVDYKILEDIPTNMVNGKEQYIAAPLCLLHQKPTGEVIPLAIQLLIPHLRYSIHINVLARTFLICQGGTFDKAIATGRKGLAVLLKKALENLTYTHLCLPDDIEARGFELGAFMPNLPSSMRKPPPQVKAPVTLEEFLDTIPEMNTTSQVLSVLWVLRNEDFDMKPLGEYDEEHFVEEEPKQLITAFQQRLAHISEGIRKRNESLKLPYNYLYPPAIENSTTI
ncbi:hypothetical protein JD844_000910 [Phrynosoma platyrhinos]|uniref:Arachidonate lipoxygenase 3 n=1 Tax=Phrynosoma platyrhinos TaxID=52577 RepID=A0ABQ7T8S0_PHRPL|nr:hypothetical protein JD844_000910 [Phrynosoma platyrhinos]